MSARFGSEGLGAWVLDRLGPGSRTPRRRGEPTEVDVRTGPTVPAAAVRVALALVGLTAVFVAWSWPGDAVPALALVLMVLVGAAPAVLPRAPLTALLLLVVGIRVLAAGPASPLVLAVLVLLLHAALHLTAVAARTGWRTRVEVAVLRDDLRAVLAAQAGAQGLALVAGLTTGGDAGGGWRFVGLAVVVGLSVLTLARPTVPWWRSTP